MLLVRLWCSSEQIETLKGITGCRVLGKPSGKDYYIILGLTLAQIEGALGDG